MFNSTLQTPVLYVKRQNKEQELHTKNVSNLFFWIQAIIRGIRASWEIAIAHYGKY